MSTYLVIGSGGREHALAWKLGQDGSRVIVAPGNDGIAADPEIDARCASNVATDDFDGLLDLARREDADLTVVGPEAPLCDGIVDHFEAHGAAIFGPNSDAARLEGSKAFANEIMDDAGVPTARWEAFDSLDDARAYVESVNFPFVIKADGLAAGKGVVLPDSRQEATSTLEAYMAEERFGEASSRVVIEERLQGPELSFIVVTDGEAVVPLATSRDHKRIGEGDTGPNTGGMGAFAPVPDLAEGLEDEILAEVIEPTLRELADRGTDYRGFLYAGLMLTEEGPRVLEFNCRMGDPEAQALLYATEADLGGVMQRAAAGQLASDDRLYPDYSTCCVVLASGGYPGADRDTGHVIDGLDRAARQADTKVFHAGTRRREDGGFINVGGRVLGVTARGKSLDRARRNAYDVVETIEWPGMQFRRDIGVD